MAPLRVTAPEPVLSMFIGRWDEEFVGLRTALQIRAQNMPDRFSGEILAQIMSSAMYLWLRLNLRLEHSIRRVDEGNWNKNQADLPEGLVDALTPRLLKLGQYIAEMSQSQAATTRQWALTRDKLPQTEEAASQPPRKKRQRRKTPTESPPVVDGPTDQQTNGTTGAHPPAISIGDRRVEDALARYLQIKHEMYGT